MSSGPSTFSVLLKWSLIKKNNINGDSDHIFFVVRCY